MSNKSLCSANIVHLVSIRQVQKSKMCKTKNIPSAANDVAFRKYVEYVLSVLAARKTCTSLEEIR